jgi:hypothetical protein
VVRDQILAHGGKPLESRVGHSFIKRSMRQTQAIFAGELSGHFYFRDAFYTDNAELAMLWLLAVLSQRGRTLSEVLRPLARYFATGELNFVVADKDACLRRLEGAFPGAEVAWLDGITIRLADWWCNVRPSNTEPVLRLNLEARTAALREALRDQMRHEVELLIGGSVRPRSSSLVECTSWRWHEATGGQSWHPRRRCRAANRAYQRHGELPFVRTLGRRRCSNRHCSVCARRWDRR